MTTLTSFRTALLRWYDAHRRDLPWRRTRDPYCIWLSEVMLQQTTVRTVEPRWQQFLERYPTIEALAHAPLDDVLAEWSGLGYYARARNLHAAANRIAEDFGGSVPASFELLLALPGMGRYTAAAVASIAFGEAVAVVDANVERVVARLDAVDRDVRTPAVKRQLWERAQELLAPRRAGDWNQAMMELGAVVCLPRAPQCSACPLAKQCKARATGSPERFPVKAPPAALESVREIAAVVRRGSEVLVLQRRESVSFGGMWETPRGELRDGETPSDGSVRILREQTGIDSVPVRELMVLRHVVMRRKIDLHVWLMKTNERTVRLDGHQDSDWIAPAEWIKRPISTTQKDIARYLETGKLPTKRLVKKQTAETMDMFGGDENNSPQRR